MIDLGLGALGALLGAFILWKLYALPRIRAWVFDQGSQKLKAWIQDVIEHPDQEQAQQVGKLAGVAFAYIMQGIGEQLSTKEGREAWKPMFEVVKDSVMGTIYATWGNILRDLKQTGSETGLPGKFNIPPQIAGLVQKHTGMDPSDIMGLLSMMQRFQGNGGSQLSAGSQASGSWKV